MMKLTAIPQNYKKNVEWIIGAYNDSGVTLPDGFQKDAIQNAVGARATNKWHNFKCEIDIVRNQAGIFLIIEDSGTVGLTGDNIDANLINYMMENGEVLAPEQRLARFSSMFNSGGNETGGGLYGAGKSVYSVASKDCTYYFDSLTVEGKYVANLNKVGAIYPKAYEGNEAKKFIYSETGLKEKKTVGTRIIIKNPVEELIKSIEDKSINNYIHESWWKIIERLPEDAGIFVSGKKITNPRFIYEGTKRYDLKDQEYYNDEYKVKNFGLYLYDKECDWNGISYYRKGMKIGEVDLKDVPDKIKGRFWGYIEVDDYWELELAQIEDKIHFGVSKGKKQKVAYQYLKHYCDRKFNDILLEWGIIKDKENKNAKLQEKLGQITDNVQRLFDKMGIKDLDKSSKRADFDVRWQKVVFPEENSERVTTGDHISFDIRVSGTYETERRLEYTVNVVDIITGDIIYQIEKDKFTLIPDEVWKKSIDFEVLKYNSNQYMGNKIQVIVKIIGSGKTKEKSLLFFYDCDKPDNSREFAYVTINTIDLPNKSKRVNFGQVLKNISYLVDNKRNNDLSYRIKVSIHNANDKTCPMIQEIASIDSKLKPFESEIINITDIVISQEIYEKYLDKGIIELRARIIAGADSGEYEKGDKIASNKYVLFLNINEKSNRKDAFIIKSVDNPERHMRAWHGEEGADKVIYINVGHAAYVRLEDYEELQMDYLNEQVLKEYLQLYLDAGKSDIFDTDNKKFSESEPQEAVDLMMRKIEEVYYNSLK